MKATEHTARPGLSGSVGQEEMERLFARVIAAAEAGRGAQLVLDCTAVEEFTGGALVVLADLIKRVRERGAELMLRHLSPRVRGRLTDTLVRHLLPPVLATAVAGLAEASRELQSPGRLTPSIN